MKKLLLSVLAFAGIIGSSYAQSVPAKKPVSAPMTVVKPAPATVAKPAVVKPIAVKSATTVVVKKDGTPDKRYKANQNLKKDGTADKRFKANKKG